MGVKILKKSLSPHPQFPMAHYVKLELDRKVMHLVSIPQEEVKVKQGENPFAGLPGYDVAKTFEEEGLDIARHSIQVEPVGRMTPKEMVELAMQKLKDEKRLTTRR